MKRGWRLDFQRLPRLRPWLAYITAPVAVAVVVLIQSVLRPEPKDFQYAFFYVAVALVAWMGGYLPGLLATVLSMLAGNYSFIHPYYEWTLSWHALITSAFFMVAAGAVAVLCASFRSALVATARSAAELERARETGRKRELILMQAGKMAHLGAWDVEILDPKQIDANRVSCSDELYRILGYEPRTVEVTKDLYFQRIHPDDRHRVMAAMRRAIATRSSCAVEHRIVRPDGTERTIQVRAEIVLDDRGQLARMLGAVQDITESKEVQAALEQSQADLNRAQAVAQIGSWRLDVRRNELMWSPECYRVFGQPLGTPQTYETFLSLVHPDDRERVDGEWTAALRGEPYDIEHRIIGVDGEVRWVRERAHLEFDGQGKLRGGFGTTQDITERKRTLEALRYQRDLNQAITQSAAEAIFVMDEEGRVILANPEAERMFGFTRAEFEGQVLHELVHHHRATGDELPASECPVARVYPSGETVRDHEDIFYRKDMSPVQVSCSTARLEVGGTKFGAALMVRDISAQKEASAERERLLAALEDRDRRKNEFLAMLSHELRNPLAPIRNSLFILSRVDPGSEQAKRAQAVIERQVDYMTRLVGDLLDVTRLMSGKFRLQREPVELNELLRRTAEDHAPVFARGGMQLETFEAPGEVWIEGDRTRLAQMIGNLLQNAVKYAQQGGKATLSLAVDPDRGRAALSVRDTGSGIPPELLPRLFEPFTQADTTLDRSKGGLGLGLAVVKGIAEMHGGSAFAHSEGIGKGAEFTIVLPVKATSARAAGVARAASAARSRARRILIIEDNVDAAESLREMLELNHHVTEIANTGPEGIQKAVTFGPDVVLCDIGLPGMDGYEVARKMRADPKLRSISLLALTGYASPEDVAKAKAAGFDGHVAKPPSMEALEQTIG